MNAMAEKRLKDRLTLKLINAYEYQIYSEIEADSFEKKVETAPKPATQKQMNYIMQLELQANTKNPIDFKGLTTSQADEYINKLNNIIKENKDGEYINR